MRPCVGNVHHVDRLYEYKAEVFQKVVVLFEVGQWESRRENQVHHDYVESADAEDGVVEEGTELVHVYALI